MSDLPFVSVVIIVCDMAKTIDRCLRSVFSLDYPKNKYEVVVVDGGSKDGTFEKVQMYPVKCIVETRKGRAIARNTGIKNAKGEIIVFLDADCVAYPDWLRKHVELHNALSAIVAIGGAVACKTNVPKIVKLRHYTYFGTMCENAPRKYTWDVATCNASFKKEVFTKIGLFDENLDVGEDANLCWNAFGKGLAVLFDPNPRVMHIYPRMSFEDYLSKKRTEGKAYHLLQIPYKLPTSVFEAVLFAPFLFLLRSFRDIINLVRYLPFKPLSFILVPYVFVGSAFWTLGYLEPILA